MLHESIKTVMMAHTRLLSQFLW